MESAIESLLQIVAADPLPGDHTSSYWQHFGRETVVERHGDQLTLRASGFEVVRPMGIVGRTLSLVERWSYRPVTGRLDSYPEVWRAARVLAGDLSATPNFNVFKSACALSVLADHWRTNDLRPRTFALIGDGFGFLGALIRRWLPESRLYCIDLPKQLVFQARTHQSADPAAITSVLAVADRAGAQVTYVLPGDIARIPEDIDCAINIASMQEMTATSIRSYFEFLRRRSTPQSRFYCVNRESKHLPGGEIVRFEDYPWRPDDEVQLDGPCPYYRHFAATYTLADGPRVLGLRIPFFNHFDGSVVHRLVRLTHST